MRGEAIFVDPTGTQYSMSKNTANNEKIIRGATARRKLRGNDLTPHDVQPASIREHLQSDIPIARDNPRPRKGFLAGSSFTKNAQVSLRSALAVEGLDAAAVEAAVEDRANPSGLESMPHGIRNQACMLMQSEPTPAEKTDIARSSI